MKSTSNRSGRSQRSKGAITPETGKINGTAIVALITTLIIPPAAWILGIVALRQIKKTKERGRVLAIVVVVFSSIYCAIILALIIAGLLSLRADFPKS